MADPVALPDVNVLVAAHIADHVDHELALGWLRRVPAFATCATTEQGLVRILSNPVANPGATCADAIAALGRLRRRSGHVQWADHTSLAEPIVDASRIRGHRHVTDFHLLNLAAHYGGVLMTLDAKIERSLAAGDRRHVRTLS